MVSLMSLWLPILLSAIFVFVASSVIHMVLPYHRSDYGKVPSEDKVMDALRPFKTPPGDYLMPCPGGPASMKDPEFMADVKNSKFELDPEDGDHLQALIEKIYATPKAIVDKVGELVK